jgi:hypothetical protein
LSKAKKALSKYLLEKCYLMKILEKFQIISRNAEKNHKNYKHPVKRKILWTICIILFSLRDADLHNNENVSSKYDPGKWIFLLKNLNNRKLVEGKFEFQLWENWNEIAQFYGRLVNLMLLKFLENFIRKFKRIHICLLMWDCDSLFIWNNIFFLHCELFL